MLLAAIIAGIVVMGLFFYGLRAIVTGRQKFNWSELRGKGARIFGTIVIGFSVGLALILYAVIAGNK